MFRRTEMSHDRDEGLLADPPISKGEPVLRALMSISKMIRALLGLELSTIGLHQGQDELLMLLDDDEPIAVSALAEKLCVRPSTVSKMLDRLVAKNYVERTSSQRDARVTMIRATPDGIAIKTKIAQVWRRIDASLDTKRPEEAPLRHLQAVEAALKARLARLR